MSWKKKLTTGAILITIATAFIYLINRIIHLSATFDNLLGDIKGNYYEWRFGKLFYTKQGSGKPLLLIHDLSTSSSSFEWNKMVDSLAKKNTVYTIDLLGCGKSDKPNLTYTNFLYVQMITDFIKNVVRDKVDIIATGESGSCVIMACANDSEIIDRVMLLNPANLSMLSMVPTKRTKVLKFLIYIPVLGTLLYNILNTKQSLERTFCSDFYYDSSKIEEKSIHTYYESAHTLNVRPKYLFASIKGRYTNANIINQLKSVNNSIFILFSDELIDNFLVAEQYKNYAPSIEIIPIKKSKRLPQLENPKEILEQVHILFPKD